MMGSIAREGCVEFEKKCITTEDLHWVAGLIEGEGCFALTCGKYPKISINMTDFDVMERLAKLLQSNLRGPYHPPAYKENWKSYWRLELTGINAVEWMQTLYPLMGNRRQEKIRECLMEWKEKGVISYKRKEHSEQKSQTVAYISA